MTLPKLENLEANGKTSAFLTSAAEQCRKRIFITALATCFFLFASMADGQTISSGFNDDEQAFLAIEKIYDESRQPIDNIYGQVGKLNGSWAVVGHGTFPEAKAYFKAHHNDAPVTLGEIEKRILHNIDNPNEPDEQVDFSKYTDAKCQAFFQRIRAMAFTIMDRSDLPRDGALNDRSFYDQGVLMGDMVIEVSIPQAHVHEAWACDTSLGQWSHMIPYPKEKQTSLVMAYYANSRTP